jgi:hypothetical protein
VTPDERFRFDFLATLIHEGMVQPLAVWLADAPGWAEKFVTRLMDDGFVDLVIGSTFDTATQLPERDARKLLSSSDAQGAYDVWLLPTASGAMTFAEHNSRAMFEYCSSA